MYVVVILRIDIFEELHGKCYMNAMLFMILIFRNEDQKYLCYLYDYMYF